jgi:DNA-binding XRE family transcriptional regulator
MKAHDKIHHFLGVVSEPSRQETLEALKSLALETMLEYADEGTNPLDLMFVKQPKNGSIEIYLQDIFPLILRYHRSKKGITQSVIASKLAMSQQVYARFERPGSANPTLATIHRLQEVLDEDLLSFA